MGIRRQAREQAMQALFFLDMRRCTPEEVIERFCGHFLSGKKAEAFFHILVEGVVANRARIDNIINVFSSNWKIDRMSCVDRNILRIAIFELLQCEDIPAKVSINEAIEIGKKFGTEESGAFINGILDSVREAQSAADKRLLFFSTAMESKLSEPKQQRGID